MADTDSKFHILLEACESVLTIIPTRTRQTRYPTAQADLNTRVKQPDGSGIVVGVKTYLIVDKEKSTEDYRTSVAPKVLRLWKESR